MLVVGAGAAGLSAALRAAGAGARVTLLNAHPRVGLKILMSGGTRCNVTHREVSARDFHGGSHHVVARILRAFTPAATREWFERDLGVALKLEETGKYFPVTDDAQTVLDALLAACAHAGVALQSGARVTRLERVGDAEGGAGVAWAAGAAHAAAPARWRAGIQRVESSAAFGTGVHAVGAGTWPLPAGTPDEWLEADAVVLATGGLSFPRTGSDGTGYALAAALGHTLVPPVPALTPLVADDPLCAAAQGVTLAAALSLWVDGRRRETVRGSLLLTHFGVSGPAALDLSRHWHRAEGRERRVTASLLPDLAPDTLAAAWLAAARFEPGRGVRRFLAAQLPERIAAFLCEEAGVGGQALAQTPRAARAALLRAVLARDLRVTGTLGYEKAEVTAGGVALAEVDPSTLESRLAPGLYLCGEILDVEGRLGGFNFQWAWSSGTVAGQAAVGTYR